MFKYSRLGVKDIEFSRLVTEAVLSPVASTWRQVRNRIRMTEKVKDIAEDLGLCHLDCHPET